MLNYTAIEKALGNFKDAKPFDHCIVDGFFEEEVAQKLSNEFLDYDSEQWYHYENAIEDKKALNNWNAFPKDTYLAFNEFYSDRLTKLLSKTVGLELMADYGLHGGGWHIHKTGGNLNPHLDYSIHPKLGKERKLNIIVYLSQELKPAHGGHLGLWYEDESKKQPGKLASEVEPKFNRAVIFDTTQNSWHGMSRALTQPDGIYRKSLAVYYLCEPDAKASRRGRALFAPREEQKKDSDVAELIKKRSSVCSSAQVYKIKK
ncbi:2OG-Fe(II) oxygenase [Rickettsiaceae bacterium]|nr:2OG-Fe(II) oxygenase [Rickettsiaceae bacterium]